MKDRFWKVMINKEKCWDKPFDEIDMSKPYEGPKIETITLEYTNSINVFLQDIEHEYNKIMNENKGRVVPKYIIIGKKAFAELYAYYHIHGGSIDKLIGLKLLVDGSSMDMSFKILCDPEDEFFNRKYD